MAFGDAHSAEERCVLAGYDSGDLKLFDLRAGRLRWEAALGNGVCGVQFDRRGIAQNKFAAACLESQYHVFDARTLHPTQVRVALRCSALRLRALPACALSARGSCGRPDAPGHLLHGPLPPPGHDGCAQLYQQLGGAAAGCRHALGACAHTPALWWPLSPQLSSCCGLQGYARVTGVAAKGATLWGCFHTPQNRELFMLTAGDGSVHLCKYIYPDKRCAMGVQKSAAPAQQPHPVRVHGLKPPLS